MSATSAAALDIYQLIHAEHGQHLPTDVMTAMELCTHLDLNERARVYRDLAKMNNELARVLQFMRVELRSALGFTDSEDCPF